MKRLFISIVFITILLLFGTASTQANEAVKICNKEIKKKQPNNKRLQAYCTQAGEYYQNKNNTLAASWYYLLGGRNDKNINEIQKNIANRSTYYNVGHCSIAHSYVLEGAYNKAKGLYDIFLKKSSVPWADQMVQSNYKLLNKIYPEKKENLRKGLKLWNKLYAPLSSTNNLYINFLKVKKAKKYKEAIRYLTQIVALQKKYQKAESNSMRNNLYRLGTLYNTDRQYRKSLETLQEVEKIYQKTSTNNKNYSDLLVWIANDYEKLYQYDNAIRYREESLKIKTKILGEDHISLSNGYAHLGRLYFKTASYPNALKLYQKAIAIIKKSNNKDDIKTAENYNSIGLIYKRMGNYQEALKYYRKALTIIKKIAGNKDINTAIGYNNLAMLYEQTGEYFEALKYGKKALAIKEKILNIKDPSLHTAYSNLGTLYKALGEYRKSLKYYTKALTIQRDVFGENHIDTATSYGLIGMLYDIMGNYKDALKYTQKALDITKRIMGEESPSTITGYSDVGFVYYDIGNFPMALKYHKKSLASAEKVLGKKHIETAKSYNNVGIVYNSMGDYDMALEYYQKALSIKEKVLGKKHISTAISYNNIGALYHKRKIYPKALEYYQKALTVREEVLGKLHSVTAESYNNMGAVAKDMKHYSEALNYYQNALSIQKKVLSEKHPSLATTYNNLGLLYQTQSKPIKALEYLHKALAIREKVLGSKHFLTALSYNSLSSTYYLTHNYQKSHHYAQLAFDNFLFNREKVFAILDSKQKEKYLASTTGYISSLLLSTYQYIYQLNKNNNTSEIRKILRSGANAWLNYKGSIFDSENAIAMLYGSTKDKKLKAKIEDLISSKRYLAKLYQSLPKPKEKETWQKNIKTTEEKISKLTNEIASNAAVFKEQQGLKNISYKDITAHLKKDELYIDYAKVGKYYYLFSLDKEETISFTQLGYKNTRKIDNLVKLFRKDINTILKGKNLTDEKLKKLTKSSKEKLSKLYELVIKQPLTKQIKSKTSLIISPDGALRLLPFETLFDKENNKYFIEEKEIRYIPSGKELVRLYKYSKNTKTKKSAVIFANPNFNTKTASASKEQIAITPNTNRSGIIKSLFRMHFAPLPGTKAEAKAIKSILKKNVKEYQKNKATEKNLMKIKEPRILHIATHGFFINDNTIPNPMLKSGIALAGANTSVIKGKSDGIVTALKLSGLDLKGTDLVVLSACETGVVDINTTDSVSGLSKAFIQAGAKDIVMSLWSVDDQATKELMSSFYREMKKKKNYAKALKAAKLKMIEEGRHPFYWGAFVVSGL